ncbi:TetM/TetW/TetO/TetS family tetracycline resistance ribosomal protection protein [Paenibacillus sp. JCM 10914]|uniref:GTP-binding protein n=1 Tax=Paenibacillus sp. JCM 10914 TaxID=1236974 RepID=UPI0003CC611B|nr:TetM/TetW/TetO/TetS family tetracycline resistance ribosomal protection protein [Paenibacillus sp. JCM 10914]GAE09149.1 ribosome protection-type tetracycline resistance related proteins, group 2 [Paenibacillus sp. JCM 10914]
MKKTIGMFAHVDAGKTTLAEQLLYMTQTISERGRVDHQSAFLDNHDIEKERGITVFADQATMQYNGSTYYLIDTPGHVDFSPEMERAIQVMDAAILVISAVEGVEGHTETVWQLLHKFGVPTFFFINKIDRVGADPARVLAEIRSELTEDVCLLNEQDDVSGGKMRPEVIEAVAERDERLLEMYMEQGYEAELWHSSMITMIREGRLHPCFIGSALQNIGISHMLEQLDQLIVTDYDHGAEFAGRVYKIRHDEDGARLTYIKSMGGTLRMRDEVRYMHGSEVVREKITQIRLLSGGRMTNTDKVEAGDLFVVTGLTLAGAGDGLGSLSGRTAYELVPTLQSRVQHDAGIHPKDMLRCFRWLDAEDPSLAVQWDEALQAIHIHVMGIIQLEVLERIVHERFGYRIHFEQPEILYKETITEMTVGSGHFEPLRHYAEVHIRLEPAERNSGLVFVNACHPDVLPVNYQHLVAQHVMEREHHGLLTGSPITDMRITLLKGRAHNKHTHGGDFREATFRALRQGLEKTGNMLLEPYYQFRVKVDVEYVGRLLSDLTQAKAHFDPPETTGDKVIVCGHAPVSTMMDYSMELAAYTKGRGTLSLIYGGYDRCHNEAEVIARTGYDKSADPEYTSSSIFCAKGSGYSVPWDEADRHMHV